MSPLHETFILLPLSLPELPLFFNSTTIIFLKFCPLLFYKSQRSVTSHRIKFKVLNTSYDFTIPFSSIQAQLISHSIKCRPSYCTLKVWFSFNSFLNSHLIKPQLDNLTNFVKNWAWFPQHSGFTVRHHLRLSVHSSSFLVLLLQHLPLLTTLSLLWTALGKDTNWKWRTNATLKFIWLLTHIKVVNIFF